MLLLFQEETKANNKVPVWILATEVKAESKKVCRWMKQETDVKAESEKVCRWI